MVGEELLTAMVLERLKELASGVDFGKVTVEVQIRNGRPALGRLTKEITLQPFGSGVPRRPAGDAS